MSLSKKSKSDDINIEDLIDDEATVEDFEEYNQIYPDLDGVSHLKNHCTSCFTHLGLSLAAVPKIRLHSVLKVTICKSCHEFYNSGEFERGEDGSELFCRWCGQGGVVFCCTNCIYVFCKECIRRNLGTAAYKKIANDNKWCCFRCDSNQLLNLRARHHAFTNYLLNRQNHVNETARNAIELKALIQEDMSTCCRASKMSTGTSATCGETPLDAIPPPLKNNNSTGKAAALPPVPSTSSYKPGPASKRQREFSPYSAPGPLSKKLKRKEEVKELVKAPETSKPVAIKPKPVPKPHLVKRREVDDESDLMSMLTPNIELEEQNHPAMDERDPIDPLDFNGPPITQNSPWRLSANQQSIPGNNTYNQTRIINPPLEEPEHTPSLHFGGHFMAMDAEPMPTARLAQSLAIRQAMSGPNGYHQNSILSLPSPGPPRLVLSRPQGNRAFSTSVTANRPPAPESPSSVFHYVNGYRIDLKAASEKQLITLPDGKVIHVRRHLTPNGGPITPLATTTPTTNSSTTPILSSYRGPTNVNMRFQAPSIAPVRLHSNVVMRRAPPVNIQRPTLAEALRPRRKTTLRPRAPLGTMSGFPRPPPPSSLPTPAPQKGKNNFSELSLNSPEVAGGKFKLSVMVDKLQDALKYTSQKCTNFQTSKTYKGVRTMEDVIELHTNLSYILLYASSRFNDIMIMNEKQLKELSSKKDKEKKGTDDELQLLEDRPAFINLDSDDEDVGGQSQAAIRCKTVLEINSGNTLEMAGPSTQLPAAETPNVVDKPIEPATNVDLPVISLDESDDEESTVSDVPNEKIIGDIIDELIDSLFEGVSSNGDDKENHPPPQTSESKDDFGTDSTGKEVRDSVHDKRDIHPTAMEVDGEQKDDQDPLKIGQEVTNVVEMQESRELPSSSESTLQEGNEVLMVLDDSKSDDDGNATENGDKNVSESIVNNADRGNDVEKPAEDAGAEASSMIDNEDVEEIFDDVSCTNVDSNQEFENAKDPFGDLLEDLDVFLDCPATDGSEIDTFADCEGVLAELNDGASAVITKETSAPDQIDESIIPVSIDEEHSKSNQDTVEPELDSNTNNIKPTEAPVIGDMDSTTIVNSVLGQGSSPLEDSNDTAVAENGIDGQQLSSVEPDASDLLETTTTPIEAKVVGDQESTIVNSVLEQGSSAIEDNNGTAVTGNGIDGQKLSSVEPDTTDLLEPTPMEAAVVGNKDVDKGSSPIEESNKNEVAENGIDGQQLSSVQPDTTDLLQPTTAPIDGLL